MNLPLDVHFEALLDGLTLSCASFCLGVLLLEIVEELDTKVSEESELLQHELSDRLKWFWREAEVIVDDLEEVVLEDEALDDGRDEAGLDSSRLLLLTVRRLLRLRPRLISTTSIEGGSTALGIILDIYAA